MGCKNIYYENLNKSLELSKDYQDQMLPNPLFKDAKEILLKQGNEDEISKMKIKSKSKKELWDFSPENLKRIEKFNNLDKINEKEKTIWVKEWAPQNQHTKLLRTSDHMDNHYSKRFTLDENHILKKTTNKFEKNQYYKKPTIFDKLEQEFLKDEKKLII